MSTSNANRKRHATEDLNNIDAKMPPIITLGMDEGVERRVMAEFKAAYKKGLSHANIHENHSQPTRKRFYAFSQDPVTADEVFRIKIKPKNENGTFSIGFTSCNPDKLKPRHIPKQAMDQSSINNQAIYVEHEAGFRKYFNYDISMGRRVLLKMKSNGEVLLMFGETDYRVMTVDNKEPMWWFVHSNGDVRFVEVLSTRCDYDYVEVERLQGRSGLAFGLPITSAGGGGCTFPASWTGSWFQSGVLNLIQVNTTHIQMKGECSETESYDKFLLYDRSDDCYRCMVIHEKHESVLQYKESVCLGKDSLSSICEQISGDAALYSMFRKQPPPAPQPCPFRPAPFSFTYSRGSGDCANPPSRADSCTDDSRLLLRYMACPDVPGTESNVEELSCLATWKEGSTRYLVGQISQVQRRNSIASDEDTYRCFIYKGQHSDKTMTYYIAQSGDATCNGLSSPTDGSRTMRLTNSDDEHNRCRFPSWIVEHHKWYSLDHTHQYHFTTKNATLKIMNEDGTFEEKRLVCHTETEQRENKYVKLVAHVTKGCESGHVCLTFRRRATGILELQQGTALFESPSDACAEPDPPQVILTTTSLAPARCPLQGRYNVISSLSDRRRRRQQVHADEPDSLERQAGACVPGDYDAASVGCSAQDTLQLKSQCSSSAYTCYGSWEEGGVGFVVAAAAPAQPPGAGQQVLPAPRRRLCLVYTRHVTNDTKGQVATELVSLSAARSCDRSIIPGLTGDKAYNLTLNGTCEQSSKYNSHSPKMTSQFTIIVTSLLVIMAAGFLR